MLFDRILLSYSSVVKFASRITNIQFEVNWCDVFLDFYCIPKKG